MTEHFDTASPLSAAPKRPLKVFLCHAHADRDAVKALYARLTQDGVDAWLDKEKLLPGQDWELEIRKAVREADVVVVCLSKEFNQAGFRQKEVRLALDTAMEQPEGEIFIIPARLEECDTLESLRKWHWVDLFEENGYQMLVRALQARAASLGAKDLVSNKFEKSVDTDFYRSPDVNQAIENLLPIVAFESTFITHGIPRPQNLQLAHDVEDIVRKEGAIPAIIGFLDGDLHIGLTYTELERLANESEAYKVDPLDFATVTTNEGSGGTTVAGTMFACKRANIKVLAAGGINGMRRESNFVIPADLQALVTTPMIIVCAGIMAISNLRATLEYLEAMSVPVIGYGTDNFPAFYFRESGLYVTENLDNPLDIVGYAKAHWETGLQSAVLVGNPITTADAISRSEIELHIERAMKDAHEHQIYGQDLNPFLLQRINELTRGKSLFANLSLLLNNARLAAQIAHALYTSEKRRLK